jgi:hypothetical protein
MPECVHIGWLFALAFALLLPWCVMFNPGE